MYSAVRRSSLQSKRNTKWGDSSSSHPFFLIFFRGETTSSCTKTTQIFNSTVHGVGNAAASIGRKIDVLLKSCSNDAVELSSIEVKKASVGPALVIAQQCKNLRTNASILSFLCALDPRRETLRTVAAIDLVAPSSFTHLRIH
ncbi:hypothetical protein DM01DRAFT_1023217 [Hesseltinella vesiculosa]|uniref:Uncharacterized protein n=1 Tax=Hesseltinella vesiculosa TaxID=101127 RepID=A0A1X2GK17_9FUNG|nr:hypothetical protein DM01DRAFT_1023217 [Hesseltinella vesiculosa]